MGKKLTILSDKEHQNVIKYASKISGNDLEMLMTFNGENALWTTDRPSDFSAHGKHAMGICQFHPKYQSQTINDPQFNDYKFQLDKCLELWKTSKTRFNAWTNGSYKNHANKFILTCN